MITEIEVRMMCFKDEGRDMSQRMQQPLEARKGKEMASPQSLQKEYSFGNILILIPQNPCWPSDLQNYKVINLCCFKPLSLWPFVTTAAGN